MEKKKLTMIMMLSIILLASCNNKPSENITNEPSNEEIESSPISSELVEAIDIYKQSIKTMQGSTYELLMSGVSNVSLSKDEVRISQFLLHTPNELYFEKASNGNAVDLLLTKIPTAYGERAYISKDICRRSSATTNEAWKEENGKILVDNWSEGKDTTVDKIYKEFGMVEDRYIDFNIDVDTVKTDDYKFNKAENGYELEFNLLIDDGLSSKSIAGYANQVYTISKRTLASVEYIKIAIKLDSDFRVINYNTTQEYKVFAAGLKATVNNHLDYSFKYLKNIPNMLF